ncbi:MAG: VanW family protein, partial [Solibacillus sp.]
MKINKIIAFSSFLIISLLHIQFNGILLSHKAYAEQMGSTIAGISVEELSKDEIREALQQEITSWTSEQLIVGGGGSAIALNTSLLQFDIDTTMNTYETMTKKPWYAFWQSKRTVNLPLEVMPSEALKNEIGKVAIWDTDKTYERVMLQAAYLKTQEVEAEVTNFEAITQERIALVIEKIPEDAMGVGDLVEVLNEQIVLPNEPFSYLETLGDQVNVANHSAVNFLASMLYSVALQSNSEILERTSQQQQPNYLEPGIEAAVNASRNQDLRFNNQTKNAMQLFVTIDGENLKVEMYAPSKEDKITVRTVRDHEVAPRIVTRYSKDLAIGEQRLIKEGEPGLRVSVYRTSVQTGEEELISSDYYAPKNRIVQKSSRQLEQVEQVTTSGMDISEDADSVDLDGDGLIDFE